MAKVTVIITDEVGEAGSNLNIQTVFEPPIRDKKATSAQLFAIELMGVMASGQLGKTHGPWKAKLRAPKKPKKKGSK